MKFNLVFLLLFASCGVYKSSIVGCESSDDKNLCEERHRELQAAQCKEDETLSDLIDDLQKKASIDDFFKSTFQVGYSYTITQGDDKSKVYLIHHDTAAPALYYYIEENSNANPGGPMGDASTTSKFYPLGGSNRVIKYTPDDARNLIDNIALQICATGTTSDVSFENTFVNNSSSFSYTLKKKVKIEDADDEHLTYTFKIDPNYPIFFQMFDFSYTVQRFNDSGAQNGSDEVNTYSFVKDESNTVFTNTDSETVNLVSDIKAATPCILEPTTVDAINNISFIYPVPDGCGLDKFTISDIFNP